ncbi:MAG: Ulp1 family isopeptidase [Wolbachia sp.]
MNFEKYVNKKDNSLCITPDKIDESSSDNDVIRVSEVIPDINIKDLVEFLKDNPSITKLSIANCKVSDEYVRELAKLTNLTSLNLSSNDISSEGVRELAELTSLTSLDLSSNGIGDKSAMELAKLTNLTNLDLRSNYIGYEGAAELLKKLTKLEELDLSDNDISYNDAKKLDKHISSGVLLLNKRPVGTIINCNKFIDQTFNKDNYSKWISNSDLAALAKHYYKWNKDNGVIFVDPMRPAFPQKQLDMWKNNRDKILISIINKGRNHWVLLVAYKNQVSFVDSLGGSISAEAKEQYNYLRDLQEQKEQPNIEFHELSFRQQREGDYCNCGVFALENARIIQENIDKDVSVIKKKLKEAYRHDKDYYERLNGKRKEFASALKEFSTGKAVQSSILSSSKKVSTKNGKHGKYAAASFVLAVAFAVGASVTVPYLAICITLTLSAFAALAIGCYCSYKANTALGDVKADQIKKDEEVILYY